MILNIQKPKSTKACYRVKLSTDREIYLCTKHARRIRADVKMKQRDFTITEACLVCDVEVNALKYWEEEIVKGEKQ